MKNTNHRQPARSTFPILRQLSNLIPDHLVPRLAFESNRPIHLVNTTTIQLLTHCQDWAKHRQREAAPGAPCG